MILFIVSRVLLVASMIFIIGYVFGNFSTNKVLTRLAKVASILMVVLIIGMNIAFARYAVRNGMHHPAAKGWQCGEPDSSIKK